MVRGPEIIVRSMTAYRIPDQFGNTWQYNPWSDRHSEVTCWAVLFDLLRSCPLLRRHVEDGKVGFGINHIMTDFTSGRPKALDLVISIPRSDTSSRAQLTFAALPDQQEIELTDDERSELSDLPVLTRRPVGDVLLALE